MTWPCIGAIECQSATPRPCERLLRNGAQLQRRSYAFWYHASMGQCIDSAISACCCRHTTPIGRDSLHTKRCSSETRPNNFLHEILRLTRHDNRPEPKRRTIGYIHFESQLRISLMAPRHDSSISEFIEQLEGKKHAWYETYQHFGKRKDYLRSLPTPSQQGNDQRPPQRQQQWSRSST